MSDKQNKVPLSSGFCKRYRKQWCSKKSFSLYKTDFSLFTNIYSLWWDSHDFNNTTISDSPALVGLTRAKFVVLVYNTSLVPSDTCLINAHDAPWKSVTHNMTYWSPGKEAFPETAADIYNASVQTCVAEVYRKTRSKSSSKPEPPADNNRTKTVKGEFGSKFHLT